jgi:uncharacterized protein DUF4917
MSTRLPDFADLPGPWPTLLMGNGASINLSTGFAYASLYHAADLTTAARELFAEFATTNFELVLQLLGDAARVGAALGSPRAGQRLIDTEYANIRDALFGAVHTTHLDHSQIPTQTLHALGEHLLGYRRVFTTNYDLTAYWALMSLARPTAITDFFHRNGQPDGPLTFDLTTTSRLRDRTQLLYLHGGLHLWHDEYTGTTGKWRHHDGAGLLDLADRYRDYPHRQPLLVSEGTSTDKLRAIRRSDYLSFALRQLALDHHDTVIFGHSISPVDRHIADAINHGPARRIAISLHTTSNQRRVARRIAELRDLFDERHQILFFHAQSHPLGAPSVTLR